jgi:hypothetical protein
MEDIWNWKKLGDAKLRHTVWILKCGGQKVVGYFLLIDIDIVVPADTGTWY